MFNDCRYIKQTFLKFQLQMKLKLIPYLPSVYSFTCSLTYSLTYSLTHLLTHSLIHSLIHLLTHLSANALVSQLKLVLGDRTCFYFFKYSVLCLAGHFSLKLLLKKYNSACIIQLIVKTVANY